MVHPDVSEESTWQRIQLTGTKHLPPNPRVVNAIGRNHAFKHAIADLVDNSIDAGASTVLIRFVRSTDRMLGLLVVDNGHGMGEAEIDNAMTLGGDREYSAESLGHFGVGLNAASLGQAKTFVVFSRVGSGHQAVGRSASLAAGSQGFECGIVDTTVAAKVLDTRWGMLETSSGTVVRWDSVRTFPMVGNSELVTAFLSQTVTELRHHLGLVLHRMLSAGEVRIWTDIFDVDLDEAGSPVPVEPIDPFAYSKAGRTDYPRNLELEVDGHRVGITCHIWPGRSHTTSFRIPGSTPLTSQGFYFYRNRRLLQAGGWNGMSTNESELQLARVVVDISDELAEFLTMNPEKTRVEVGQAFAQALHHARTSQGWGWTSFLDDARDAYKKSRKRNRDRAKVLPPGKGFTPRLKRSIGQELEFIGGEDPIDFRWDRVEDGALFAIDRQQRTVWLNRDYRRAVLGDKDGSLNDAPLVKTLLYLLVENLFHGQHLGARDKDNLELWSELLTRAADEELT